MLEAMLRKRQQTTTQPGQATTVEAVVTPSRLTPGTTIRIGDAEYTLRSDNTYYVHHESNVPTMSVYVTRFGLALKIDAHNALQNFVKPEIETVQKSTDYEYSATFIIPIGETYTIRRLLGFIARFDGEKGVGTGFNQYIFTVCNYPTKCYDRDTVSRTPTYRTRLGEISKSVRSGNSEIYMLFESKNTEHGIAEKIWHIAIGISGGVIGSIYWVQLYDPFTMVPFEDDVLVGSISSNTYGSLGITMLMQYGTLVVPRYAMQVPTRPPYPAHKSARGISFNTPSGSYFSIDTVVFVPLDVDPEIPIPETQRDVGSLRTNVWPQVKDRVDPSISVYTLAFLLTGVAKYAWCEAAWFHATHVIQGTHGSADAGVESAKRWAELCGEEDVLQLVSQSEKK